MHVCDGKYIYAVTKKLMQLATVLLCIYIVTTYVLDSIMLNLAMVAHFMFTAIIERHASIIAGSLHLLTLSYLRAIFVKHYKSDIAVLYDL